MWVLLLIAAAIALYLYLYLYNKNESNIDPKDKNSNDTDVNYDNWESYDFYNSKEVKANGIYKINYEDGHGNLSTRDIEIKRISFYNDNYAISAHCMLRNSHRHFLNHRITSAVDVETGEIVNNLAEYAINKFNNSPEGLLYKAEEKAMDAVGQAWTKVSALFYVAKADGRMQQAERLVIAEAIKHLGYGKDLDINELEKACKVFLAPDHLEFKRNINLLAKNKDKEALTMLNRYTIKIINTQKTIDPMETAALQTIENAIAKIN